MLMMSVIGLTTGLSSFERAWKRFSFNHLFPHNFFTKKKQKKFLGGRNVRVFT